MSRKTLRATTFFFYLLRQRAVIFVLTLAVFNPTPNIMNSPTISLEDRNHLLAYAIPALSASAGSAQVGGNNVFTEEKNMILYKDDSKWPRNGGFVLNDDEHIIWCHSDFVLVPHFHTYQLFDDMKTRIDSLPSVIP